MKFRVLLILAVLVAPLSASAYDILFEDESAYHHVRVTEDNGYRFLAFDRTRGTQSAMRLNDPAYLEYMYSRVAFAGLAYLTEAPKDVLFVGLGGASMPKFMRKHYPEATIDIVELDPLVIRVAGEFFEFKQDERMKIQKFDARVYMGKVKKQYDIIFLDAYDARSIPFHLTTREFMELVRSRLKPNGVVVANIWSPRLNEFFEAEIKTFQATFPELYIYRAGTSGNYIFIATNQAGREPIGRLRSRAQKLDREKEFHFNLADLIRSYCTYATNRECEAVVLTDDHAPVNVMRWREKQE